MSGVTARPPGAAITETAGGPVLQGPGGPYGLLTAAEAAAVRSGVSGAGLRVVALGDSLEGYNCVSVSIASITLSGSVITVVTNSAHQMRNGQRCNVGGTSNATFHVLNAPITYIGSASFSYGAPAGAAGTATGGGVSCLNQLNSVGAFVQTNARLNGRMSLVANLGVGGALTAAIRANAAAAFAIPMDILWLGGGTNDVIQDVPYADTVANIEAIVSEAVTRGVVVVIRTVPPFASGGAFHTVARNANLLNVNRFIRNLGQRYRGVYISDAYRQLIQPLDASGFGNSAYYQASDSVHWNPRGAARIGAAAASLLSTLIPAVDNRVTSITDNYGTSTANRDLMDRAPWTNSGGTVNAPNTGTVATGWIVDSSGTWTVAPAVSMVARADGLGFDIVVTGTPGAASCNFTVRTDSTLQNTRLPSFVGKQYRWLCEVTVTNAVVGQMRSLDVYAAASIGGVSGIIATAFTALNQTGKLSFDSDAATTLLLPTSTFEIPSGAVTNNSFTVRATCDAASASAITVAVGSVRMMPMDDV